MVFRNWKLYKGIHYNSYNISDFDKSIDCKTHEKKSTKNSIVVINNDWVSIL